MKYEWCLIPNFTSIFTFSEYWIINVAFHNFHGLFFRVNVIFDYCCVVVLFKNDFFFLLWFVADTLVHHNGYGFVQFASEEEGRQAVEAENGTMFHGKKISEYQYDWNKHFSGACTDITGLPLAAISFPLHTGLSHAPTLPRNNLLEWISKSAHGWCWCCPVNVRNNTG